MISLEEEQNSRNIDFYLERDIAIPYISEETIGNDFIWIMCMHGSGASVRLYREVHKISKKFKVTSCLFTGGYGAIVFAEKENNYHAQMCLRHVAGGGLIAVAYEHVQEELISYLKAMFPKASSIISEENIVLINSNGTFSHEDQKMIEAKLQ